MFKHEKVDAMKECAVPEDFPREPVLGAVSGMHPKLLVRRVDGKYVDGFSEEALCARHNNCEDMASQLAEYVQRKRLQNSAWTLEEFLVRVEDALRIKVQSGAWYFTPEEIVWMMKRVHHLLIPPSDILSNAANQSSNAGVKFDTTDAPRRASSEEIATLRRMALAGLYPKELSDPLTLSVVDVALGRRHSNSKSLHSM